LESVKHEDQLRVAVCVGDVQWRLAFLGLVLEVGAGSQQEPRQVCVPTARGDREGLRMRTATGSREPRPDQLRTSKR